ncbi:MarR family transcriptional regulator [Desulfovibrio sp. UCD-KL4C]|uniref:MarR family transcriptional regulator n=1 Tax=Desulfovibrio sp. UCD-KL4C TaxID=2578120 RepID=UPI0025B9D2EF|nr:MarR family transcriptional regulator [Desulfovibrio sp. UCD-KL4C]
MTTAPHIIDVLVKILQQADAFKHGREELFAAINLTEIHCIHWIGSIDRPNATKISNKMDMTRGAISKISKKLLNKNFIETYQKPTNNKEIYFQLTETGQEMYDEHKACHEHARQEKLSILKNYSEDEQATILNFLKDIYRHIDHNQTCKTTKDIPSID